MKIGKELLKLHLIVLVCPLTVYSILLTVASYVLLFNKGGNNSSKKVKVNSVDQDCFLLKKYC
jgi:hypothetical protein